MSLRATFRALTTAAALALSATPALAVQLVPGGALQAQPRAGATPEVGHLAADGFASSAAGEPAFSMAFTPRGGMSLLLGESQPGPSNLPALRLDLGGSLLGHHALESGDPFARGGGLAAERAGLDTGSSGGLLIGGALQWERWSLGGGYTQTDLLGDPADLMGASIGYGALTARLAYGAAPEGDRTGGSLWLFSTDLAASSWLSLEGDLAVRSRPETEPATVGRLGLRLNF